MVYHVVMLDGAAGVLPRDRLLQKRDSIESRRLPVQIAAMTV